MTAVAPFPDGVTPFPDATGEVLGKNEGADAEGDVAADAADAADATDEGEAGQSEDGRQSGRPPGENGERRKRTGD